MLEMASSRYVGESDTKRIQDYFEDLYGSYAAMSLGPVLPGSKPTVHRIDKDICGFYLERIGGALREGNFIMAETALMALPRFLSEMRLEEWYSNPNEKDGEFHHNRRGRERLEDFLNEGERLRASIGEYDVKRYGQESNEVEGVFASIYRHIKSWIEQSSKGMRNNPHIPERLIRHFSSLEKALKGQEKIDLSGLQTAVEETEEHIEETDLMRRYRDMEAEEEEELRKLPLVKKKERETHEREAEHWRDLRKRVEMVYVDIQILHVVNERYRHFSETGNLNSS